MASPGRSPGLGKPLKEGRVIYYDGLLIARKGEILWRSGGLMDFPNSVLATKSTHFSMSSRSLGNCLDKAIPASHLGFAAN